MLVIYNESWTNSSMDVVETITHMRVNVIFLLWFSFHQHIDDMFIWITLSFVTYLWLKFSFSDVDSLEVTWWYYVCQRWSGLVWPMVNSTEQKIIKSFSALLFFFVYLSIYLSPPDPSHALSFPPSLSPSLSLSLPLSLFLALYLFFIYLFYVNFCKQCIE